MKSTPRWPLHPAPTEGEALSSWINRVALCYQMDVHDLLEHDLGHGQVDDLDTAPPLSLLTALSQRSGIELGQLRCMSVAGWAPWLLDSLDDRLSAALETYVFPVLGITAEAQQKDQVYHELARVAAQPAKSPWHPPHHSCFGY